MGALWRIAEECKDEGGRWPGQQERYGSNVRSVFDQGKEIAMSELDQPIDQMRRNWQVLNQRQGQVVEQGVEREQ